MSDRLQKQHRMREAYEALEGIDRNNKLLRLVTRNGNGEFELTEEFRKKYVLSEDMGEFRSYARYVSALDEARKELLEKI